MKVIDGEINITEMCEDTVSAVPADTQAHTHT